MREKLAPLEAILAAERKKKLDLSIKEKNVELHLWYSSLDAVEGRHKVQHSKSVHVCGSKMISISRFWKQDEATLFWKQL